MDPATRSMNDLGSFNLVGSANRPCTPVASPAQVSSLLVMKDVTRSISCPCQRLDEIQVDVFYITI
jgi:hypothetical protein